MKKPGFRFALLVILLSALPVQLALASVRSVNCDDPKKDNSINAALALLNPAEPSTLHVSGTCSEVVLVGSFQRLTMIGNPAATIHGQVQVVDSPSFVMRDITVTGATGFGFALACAVASSCFLTNVTVEGSFNRGLFVQDRSKATLADGTIRNNAGPGVWVDSGSELTLLGGSVENNGGSGSWSRTTASSSPALGRASSHR